MMTAAIRRADEAPFYATPLGVWLIVALWGASHLLLRGSFSGALGTDDMFETILVQKLSAGYMLRQPPLYEWLLWSAQQLVGPTIWAALLVKYGLISLASLFLFLLARRAIPDPRIAALCVFGFSLFYQFGWNLHEGVTHTIVLVFACAFTAWAFVRALETRSLWFYLLIGIGVGIGLLSKHSYPLFPLALIGACVSDRVWRARLLLPGLVLSLAAALIVYSPYGYWIVSEGLALFSEVSATMGLSDEVSHLQRAAQGLGRLVFALLGFSAPLVPIVLLLFWPRYVGLLAPSLVQRLGYEAFLTPKTDLSDVGRLLKRVVLIMIGLTALLIVITGATYVKERHMHPLLLMLPIWMFADLARFDVGRRWRWLGVIVLAVVVIGFSARVPGMVAPDRVMCGGGCRHMKPYEGIRDQLAALGASEATLIGENDYTAGNLRVLFPDARIVSRSWPVIGGPRDKCFFVWEQGTDAPQTPAMEVASSRLGMTDEQALSASYLAANWPHLWKPEGWRTTWWGVVELSSDTPLCR
ncbi:MAG: glycosyltransferase family 39 protein [Rhodobacteraceae bacterium]|nr:glycosyltransferase family 39 protein [Paracoccaceae bacterium]